MSETSTNASTPIRTEGIPPLRFLLVFHDSLCPGRSGDEIAAMVDQTWRPLVELLEGFPKLRIALHPSGTLLDWLIEEAPVLVEHLGRLVARGQVEILCGPHYGTVLQIVPERDALEQLRLHRQWVEDNLRFKTRGAWLPLWAWDPGLPRLLAKTGLRYVFVDEGLLVAAGHPRGAPHGWTVTERAGAAVGLIALDRQLSLLGPQVDIGRVQAEFEARAYSGRGLVAAALPVERFGGALVPGQAGRVEADGWMRRFFEMLESQSSWLRTRHAWHVTERDAPQGRIYLPAATMPEMGEAVLPIERGRVYAQKWRELVEIGSSDGGVADDLLGPPFEAALVRHDAANRLHKRLLRASGAVHRLRRRLVRPSADVQLERALDKASLALYRGQSAAPLHTGPGGALGEGQVRHAAWLSLLDAERAALEALGELDRLRHEVLDYDCDAQKEILVTSPALQVVVRPAAGGALAELHVWGVGNLLNTVCRSPEVWHDNVAVVNRLPALVEPDDVAPAFEEPLVSVHVEEDEATEATFLDSTPILPLEPDLDRLLVEDRHRRLAFHEHFLGETANLENIRLGQHPQLGDFLDARYRLTTVEQWDDGQLVIGLDREGTVQQGDAVGLVRISKRFRFHPRLPVIQLEYQLGNRHGEPLRSRFAVELNLNLDSAQTAARYLRIPGYGPISLDHAGGARSVSKVAYVLEDHAMELQLLLQRSAHLYYFPVATPLLKGEGCVSGYQGTCVLLAWNADLWGGEKARFDIQLRVANLKD